MPICGVYAIVNMHNGKRYVGSSRNVAQRFREHRCALRHGRHHSQHLQRAWDKYGEDVFDMIVLEACAVATLVVREQHWMDSLHVLDKHAGYNMRPDAANCTISEAAKQKISDANRGRKMSPEFCEKQRQRMLGNTNTLGYKPTAETREKLSRARRGKPAWNRGVAMPSQTREAIRKAAVKPVIQFDLQGAKIATYDSIVEAAAAVERHATSLVGCLRGKTQTCGGYRWSYADG